uniref:Ig-like domain-containing protein n=1 Tax=Trichobilharzia regenti TaxID=157069 RepID=A0AA85K4I7_TRIRE
VTWRFNGGTLPIGTNRVDKLRTSIVVINELQSIHEGSYECEQKTRKQRGHILQAP